MKRSVERSTGTSLYKGSLVHQLIEPLLQMGNPYSTSQLYPWQPICKIKNCQSKSVCAGIFTADSVLLSEANGKNRLTPKDESTGSIIAAKQRDSLTLTMRGSSCRIYRFQRN
jgi:hypothetical protein